jgi:hypothetical protein
MASRSHFLEGRAFVFEFFPGKHFELLGEFHRALASVGLDDSNHDIFAAILPANSLAQHAVGFAHAGCVAEEQLKDAACPPGFGSFSSFQPIARES